jgi:hypothetical protein
VSGAGPRITWAGDSGVFADLKGLEPQLRAMLAPDDHTHYEGDRKYLLHQHPHDGPHDHPPGDLGTAIPVLEGDR